MMRRNPVQWLLVLLASAATACGGEPGEPAPAGDVPAVPLDALGYWPMAIGGGPLGDAEPVAGVVPVVREHAAAVGLIPVADRELPPGLGDVQGWLNVARRFDPDELAGRVILIDFWTAGCSNCIQMIPILEKLGADFAGDPLLFIGVHSQKFDEEASTDSIRKAMLILGVTHPVALDTDKGAWQAWDVGAWPTFFLIDARGRVCKYRVGGASYDRLHDWIESALAEGAAEGSLSRQLLGFLGRERDRVTPLSHPEKIAATPDGYAVADTGHDRVVLVDANGKLVDVVGDGTPGWADGAFSEARFSSPRGLAAQGDVVYVADSENYRIRAIHRSTGQVTTLAGSGERGSVMGSLDALTTGLSTPWDVTLAGDRLFVAVAGAHQLAELDVGSSRIVQVAGTGKEGLADGAALAAKLAQPSGLVGVGGDVFFADAESSSVRRLSLADQTVTTLVGKGLYSFGDVDGPASSALLQHPLGIAYGDGALFVADTYNSKLKRIDPASGDTTTVYGSGDHEQLFEPGGLVFVAGSAGPYLLVADTGNHRILKVTVDGASAEPWSIEGLTPP